MSFYLINDIMPCAQPQDGHEFADVIYFMHHINPLDSDISQMLAQIEAMTSDELSFFAMHLSNSEAFRSEFTNLCNHYFEPSNHPINLGMTMTTIHDIIFRLIVSE
jgi:hypothetical protein